MIDKKVSIVNNSILKVFKVLKKYIILYFLYNNIQMKHKIFFPDNIKKNV